MSNPRIWLAVICGLTMTGLVCLGCAAWLRAAHESNTSDFTAIAGTCAGALASLLARIPRNHTGDGNGGSSTSGRMGVHFVDPDILARVAAPHDSGTRHT